MRPARRAGGALPVVILALAWLCAFSARTNTLTLGPVLPLIQKDLGMSYAESGLLFSIPVVMMGLFAIPSGLIIARLGVKWVLLLSLAILGAGGGLRATTTNVPAMFVFTALAGIGIGLVQPVLPRLVKDWFAQRTGTMTGVYSNGFVVGALAATTLTVPVLLPAFGALTWRGPFLLWSAVVWATALAWLFVPGQRHREKESLRPFGRIFRNRLAWIVSGVFFTQTVMFYILNAWLVNYYQSFGWSLGQAASTLGALTAGSVIGGSGGPMASDRWGRRPLLLVSALLSIVGVLGLLFVPEQVYWLWPFIMGVSLSALFTVSLVIPVDVAPPDEVGAFSGLMMAVGYSGVLGGPAVIGWMRDVSGTHVWGVLTLLAMCFVQLGLVLQTPETAPRLRPGSVQEA